MHCSSFFDIHSENVEYSEPAIVLRAPETTEGSQHPSPAEPLDVSEDETKLVGAVAGGGGGWWGP